MGNLLCCNRPHSAIEGPQEGELRSEAELRASLEGHGQTFDFQELVSSTNGFEQASIIGRGGFGDVYRGFIQRTQQNVAIKRRRQGSTQGDIEFVREVIALSRANHPNIITLVGYCFHEQERLLVYELLPSGSLNTRLFDQRQPPLDWLTRIKIAVGVAKGLEYLHHTLDPPIMYRDMKASNILLDDEYNPKLSDFGLAREGRPTTENGLLRRIPSRRMGTEGYVSPDCWNTGNFSIKSDVYSFGAVLFVILTGRKAFNRERDSAERFLVPWVKTVPLTTEESFRALVDPRLERNYNQHSLVDYIIVGRRCILSTPEMRPNMPSVRRTLQLVESQGLYTTSPPISEWDFDVPTTSTAAVDGDGGAANS